MSTSREKKIKASRWLVLLVIVVSIYIMFGFVYGMNNMFWFLAIMNLLFGPVCLVLYLIEVKKGVFAYDESDTEKETLS